MGPLILPPQEGTRRRRRKGKKEGKENNNQGSLGSKEEARLVLHSRLPRSILSLSLSFLSPISFSLALPPHCVFFFLFFNLPPSRPPTDPNLYLFSPQRSHQDSSRNARIIHAHIKQNPDSIVIIPPFRFISFHSISFFSSFSSSLFFLFLDFSCFTNFVLDWDDPA